MQEKVLKTLEYDKIAEMLKAKTVTCAGAELAEGMEPYDTFDKVKSALAFTAEAETVIIRTGRSPVDSFGYAGPPQAPRSAVCISLRAHGHIPLPARFTSSEAIEKEENVPSQQPCGVHLYPPFCRRR